MKIKLVIKKTLLKENSQEIHKYLRRNFLKDKDLVYLVDKSLETPAYLTLVAHNISKHEEIAWAFDDYSWAIKILGGDIDRWQLQSADSRSKTLVFRSLNLGKNTKKTVRVSQNKVEYWVHTKKRDTGWVQVTPGKNEAMESLHGSEGLKKALMLVGNRR